MAAKLKKAFNKAFEDISAQIHNQCSSRGEIQLIYNKIGWKVYRVSLDASIFSLLGK